jgi:ERCC4-related helicase
MNYDTYSQIILGIATKENTLLFLPERFDSVNLKKLLTKFFLKSEVGKKIAVITLEKESVKSGQTIFMEDEFENYQANVFLSTDKTENRKELYSKSNIVLITPHLLKNDFLRQLIVPKDFSLLLIDNAHLARGKHALALMLEIFHQNNSFIRIIGFSSYYFTSMEELQEVCQNLLTTKIEFRNSEQEILISSRREQIITVPINKQLYDFCFEVNRYIREYQTFLKEKGVQRPLTVRKEFPSFVMHLKTRFDDDQQRVLLRKAVELMNFQTLKDLVESYGVNAAIRYMNSLRDKNENTEEEKISNLHSKFVRTPIFTELLDELRKLSESTDHPKYSRLLQLIHDLKNKRNFSRFIIISNNKSVVQKIPKFLSENSLESKILPRKQSKEKNTIKSQYEEGRINILVSTKIENLNTDALIFFNNPSRYSDYLQITKNGQQVYILLTHRSNEERVFHNFRNREKKFEKLLADPNIQKTLVLNQQSIFNKKMHTKMDNRTKAMVSVVQALSRRKTSDSKNHKKNEIDEKITYLQFLANCTKEEAKIIIAKIPNEFQSKLEDIKLDFLSEIFPEKRARKIYENIKGRKALVAN